MNGPINIIIFLPVLLISVVLHEMMHAYMAYKLGDDLAHSRGRISLNPMAHIDPFLSVILPATMILLGLPPIMAAKPVPINTSRIKGSEFGFAAVAIAGPLTNLAIAFVFGAFLKTSILNASILIHDIFILFVQINVALFAFNMLPIPPLDGSRLLYAVAPEPVQDIMRQIESFGLIGLIVILTVASPLIFSIVDYIQNIVFRLIL